MKKKLILEADAVTISNPNAVQPATSSVPAQTKNSGNNITDMLGKLLPIILGIGGVSMLFGKGLFGIGGGKGGLFGGFWGKLIGGTALATILPSLWSNQGFGDRIGGAFKKLAAGDIGGFFKTFLGLDGGADKEIKKTEETVKQISLNKDTIENKAKQFTKNAIPFVKLANWLKENKYVDGSENLIYVTPTIALIAAKTTTDTEKELNQGKDTFIAILFMNDQQQVQVQMSQPIDLTKCISTNFAKLLTEVFTENHLNSGLSWLKTIQDQSAGNQDWLQAFKSLINGLKSVNKNNIGEKTVLQLCNDGFTNLCESHSLKTIDLPPAGIEESIKNTLTKFTLICEENEESSFSELMNDPELAALKEDPSINKFDEDIKLLDENIKDEYTRLIQKLLLNQDDEGKPIYEKPDACVIYGVLGKDHYYYCRNRQNGYLTNDASQSVIFPGTDIEKIAKESPLEVSTGEHMSVEESIPILWNEYKSDKNKELTEAFTQFKESNTNITDEKQCFTEFIKKSDPKMLPFKKEKRDVTGNSLKEILQKFLIALKLPQFMKVKKPGIKVNVYETNLQIVEKVKTLCKEKLNVEI